MMLIFFRIFVQFRVTRVTCCTKSGLSAPGPIADVRSMPLLVTASRPNMAGQFAHLLTQKQSLK
jgi:hypothetical protein